MNNGAAGGVDSPTVEILKAELEAYVDILHYFLHEVWEQGQLPEDWRRGLIVKLPMKGVLRECSNWRDITLMATAAKLLGRRFQEGTRYSRTDIYTAQYHRGVY